MPIPLLFIGVGVATGAFGIGKSIKAGADQKEANRTNESANWIVREATGKIEKCRRNCGAAITKLGNTKLRILDESIKPFIEEFEKLNHIELSESKGLNELEKLVLDKESFSELKELQSMGSSMISGLASGAMAGAITAFGAYGAAGALATASTGTAIATLSGAAATNATLAFFGGGSLAAGGLGIAGGSMVLGGLVAGPALAILGSVLGGKASANLDNAYSNLATARKYSEEMDAAAVVCIGIRKRAAMFNRFLISLNSVFEPLIYEMKCIIEAKGNDFREFTNEEKAIVAEAMALAGAIKSILDTPMLDASGNLTTESEKIVEETHKKLSSVMDNNVKFSDDKEESKFNVELTEAGIMWIEVVKAMRQMLGFGFAEAKGFVENTPQIIKADIRKTEAEAIKKILEAAGAKITIK